MSRDKTKQRLWKRLLYRGLFELLFLESLIETFHLFSDCLFDCHLLFILNRETKDDNLEQELSLADRRNKREIRMLEGEIPLWQVIVEKLNAASKTMLKYSLIAP